MKLKPYCGYGDTEKTTIGYLFWCPGCKEPHSYRIKRVAADTHPNPCWTFNGNLESPSFTPSLLMYEHTRGGNVIYPRCHLFMTDGQLIYCSDSGHALAGKTVPVPDWEDGRDWGT